MLISREATSKIDESSELKVTFSVDAGDCEGVATEEIIRTFAAMCPSFYRYLAEQLNTRA